MDEKTKELIPNDSPWARHIWEIDINTRRGEFEWFYAAHRAFTKETYRVLVDGERTVSGLYPFYWSNGLFLRK